MTRQWICAVTALFNMPGWEQRLDAAVNEATTPRKEFAVTIPLLRKHCHGMTVAAVERRISVPNKSAATVKCKVNAAETARNAVEKRVTIQNSTYVVVAALNQ